MRGRWRCRRCVGKVVHQSVCDCLSLLDAVGVDFGGQLVVEEVLEQLAAKGFEELVQSARALRYSSLEADLGVEFEADFLPRLFQPCLCFSFLADAFGTLNDELAEQKVEQRLSAAFVLYHIYEQLAQKIGSSQLFRPVQEEGFCLFYLGLGLGQQPSCLHQLLLLCLELLFYFCDEGLGEVEFPHPGEEQVVLVVGVEAEAEGVVGGLDLGEFSQQLEGQGLTADQIQSTHINTHHEELSQRTDTLWETPFRKSYGMEKRVLSPREGAALLPLSFTPQKYMPTSESALQPTNSPIFQSGKCYCLNSASIFFSYDSLAAISLAEEYADRSFIFNWGQKKLLNLVKKQLKERIIKKSFHLSKIFALFYVSYMRQQLVFNQQKVYEINYMDQSSIPCVLWGAKRTFRDIW